MTAPIHFSDLKSAGRSALHLQHAIASEERAPTPAMLLGLQVHGYLLGFRPGTEPVLWEGGDRRGNAWKAFEAAHQGCDIVKPSEVAKARAIADAVRNDPVASQFLGDRHEVPAEWEFMGRKCATSGIDIIGELPGGAPFIAELKTTADASLYRFPYLCSRFAYHAQLAFYDQAARSIGVEPQHHYIIGVESVAPYAVTVLHLSPAILEQGRALIHAWMEKLLACESANHWPGYAQRVVEWELPDDGLGLDFGDDESEAAE